MADEEKSERTLLAHRYLYYVLGLPVISDFEYDKLEREHLKRFPDSVSINKPGSDNPLHYSESVKQKALMLALNR